MMLILRVRWLILGRLINFHSYLIIVLCNPAHLGHNQGYVERQKQKNNKITNNKNNLLASLEWSLVTKQGVKWRWQNGDYLVFCVIFWNKSHFFGLHRLAERTPETQGFFLVLSAWIRVVFWGVTPQIHYQRVCFGCLKVQKRWGEEGKERLPCCSYQVEVVL